ncbi:hypothetical protein [Dyadobacter sp. CY326]|uniref:hypothetical protein n=1 Tax=Dyadobacter sp. CY326 TaxID=2907300 RepID=UPI001F1B44C9|nr:hypothetical protein [Dyadobacter sp. CY326]MCE7065191.1 hypothetical protein [Dyadobacter sp. CY326]
MKIFKFIAITVSILGFYIPVFSQVHIIERIPDESYISNWSPVFRKLIVSYVQLPGDSLEYKKVDIYVQYKPGPNLPIVDDLSKYNDLIRFRYLGAVLILTGRRFNRILDDSVLGIENSNLTIQDQLLNNEMISTR